MNSKGVIVGVAAFVMVGWLIVSSADSEGERHERIRKAFPDPFCEEAAKLVATDLMLEEQYTAFNCSLRTLVDHYEYLGVAKGAIFMNSMLSRYPAMTEPTCWQFATDYLTEVMPLNQYIEQGCDPSRIPTEDVFQNWLRQR